MKLSVFVSGLAWLSVFVLGGLGVTHIVYTDTIFVVYWFFCFLIGCLSSGMSMVSDDKNRNVSRPTITKK